MNLLNKIIVLMMLIGFYAPVYAAVESIEGFACEVYSADESDGDDVDDDEEPDCE